MYLGECASIGSDRPLQSMLEQSEQLDHTDSEMYKTLERECVVTEIEEPFGMESELPLRGTFRNTLCIFRLNFMTS